MTKIEAQTDEYQPGGYLTLNTFLTTMGLREDEINNLDAAKKAKFQNYVNAGNRKVEAALYPHQDALPIGKNTESFAYAKSMAFNWAKFLKLADEGSQNSKDFKDAFFDDKRDLIKTLKAQPQQVNTRKVSSSGFEETTIPYSQSYGLSDFL